jgi:hypothetical protein
LLPVPGIVLMSARLRMVPGTGSGLAPRGTRLFFLWGDGKKNRSVPPLARPIRCQGD